MRKRNTFPRMLLVLLVSLALTACGGGLSGTYTAKSGIGSYTFQGNKVSASVLGISVNGTYKIDGDKIIFTYDFAGSKNTVTQSFSKNGNELIINGESYLKD